MLQYVFDSLKYFDDIVILDEKTEDIGMLRNKAKYHTNCEYLFHLDFDEVINPNVYFELKEVLSRNNLKALVFPRCHIKEDLEIYAGEWRFPDWQGRLHYRDIEFSKGVHEILLTTRIGICKYVIVHYGNSLFHWNLEHMCQVHKKWKRLGAFNFYDAYSATNDGELLQKVKQHESYPITNLKDVVLPDLEVLKRISELK
jgi:hypothetical protein